MRSSDSGHRWAWCRASVSRTSASCTVLTEQPAEMSTEAKWCSRSWYRNGAILMGPRRHMWPNALRRMGEPSSCVQISPSAGTQKGLHVDAQGLEDDVGSWPELRSRGTFSGCG